MTAMDNEQKKRRLMGLIASAIFAFAVGCSSQPELTAEDTNAIEIAKTAISEHPEWHAYSEFDKPERDADTGHWTVTVWRNKQSLAGSLVVDIDEDGKVISIRPKF